MRLTGTPPACRADFEAVLQRRAFSFSVLVHSDPSSALVDFLPSSSVLQAGHWSCQLALALISGGRWPLMLRGHIVFWRLALGLH